MTHPCWVVRVPAACRSNVRLDHAQQRRARALNAPAIEIHDLHKSFGTVQALDGLDLTVQPGEVAGFLGPTGPASPPTIRVLLGLLRADSGTARLFGGDPWADAVALHRRLAYVPGDVSLWPNLTGGEAIDFLTRLRRQGADKKPQGRPARALRARPHQEGPHLLQGQPAEGRPRRGVLHRRRPADPRRADVGPRPAHGGRVHRLRARGQGTGTSVLLSSHILHEVEKVCDTVTIIRNGVSVESGTLDELRHLTRSNVTAVVVGGPGRSSGAARRARPRRRRRPTAERASPSTSTTTRSAQSCRRFTALGVRSLTAAPPSLEELFMRHYGDVLAV